MAELTIRLDHDPQRFVAEPAVGINLEKLETDDGVATADVEPGRIFYLTTHYVVREKDTIITIRLFPPDGYRVRFRDYPDDLSAQLSWTAGVAFRDYFQYRRVFLEAQA